MGGAGASWFEDPAALLAELRRSSGPEARPSCDGYEDLVEIGRGGQGVVFAATQTSTGRRVAVKVLPGAALAGSSHARRFDREVRLVATLAHESIVRVHDRGVTPDGAPFLVMELVEGTPLDVWWQRLRQADGDGRLRQTAIARLFAQLAGALAHAHGRGVLHRDLKPSNVRVDEFGRPRILDFGLAKGINDAAFGLSLSGEFLGSLPWASPEQVSGAPTSAATDVYQIGVLLYQALADRFPYDVTGTFREVIDRIGAALPPHPATLDRRVDADLGAIALRCLEKQPAERYPTALDVQRDLDRWHRGEPLGWGADSGWTMVRKQLRRHRTAVAVTAGTLALAIGFGAVMTVLWVRAANAEQRASAELAQSSALVTFLDDILSAADPDARGRDVRLLDVTQRASDDLAAASGLHPATRAALHGVLGRVFLSLDDLKRAGRHFDRAVETGAAALGAAHPATLRARAGVAQVAIATGSVAAGVRQMTACCADAEMSLGEAHPQTADLHARLGGMLMQSGRDKAAVARLRAALAEQTEAGASPASLGITRDHLAMALLHTGDLEEAQDLHDEALAALDAGSVPDPAAAVKRLNNYASFVHSSGDLELAKELYEAALARHREVLGSDHVATLAVLGNVGKLLLDQRAFAAAEPYLREVHDRRVRRQGARHPAAMLAAHNLGALLLESGTLEQADDVLTAAARRRAEVLGAEHADTLVTKTSLGMVRWRRGEREQSVAIGREVLAAQRRRLGDDNIDTAISMNNLAKKLEELGELDEAAALYEQAVDGGTAALPEGHWFVALFRSNQGVCLRRLERFAAAAAALVAAIADLEATFGAEDSRTLQAIRNLAEVYDAWDRPAEARRWRKRLGDG
ncbi:MAG: serine/threonine-protein kinase [Planctomycetota bacterium]